MSEVISFTVIKAFLEDVSYSPPGCPLFHSFPPIRALVQSNARETQQPERHICYMFCSDELRHGVLQYLISTLTGH